MNKHDDELPLAKDASGNWVHIEDPHVKRGLACGCFCPKCNARMIANLGQIKRPYFSHYPGTECHGAYMTILHKLAEEIIAREKMVMGPLYKSILPERIVFEEVEIEERKDRPDLQPDIVGITKDGQRWHIEIKNTSEVNDDKERKIRESNITCLEIDVSSQIADENTLRDFLINSKENRRWINNPIYDKIIEEREKGKKAAEQEKIRKEEAEIERKLSSIDKSKYDIRDEYDCRSCEHYEYGLCVYQDKSLHRHGRPTIIICNKEKRIRDEEEKANREQHVVPFSTSDNSKKEVQPYFAFNVKGLSLREICDRIKEDKNIRIKGFDVLWVEKINIRSCNDGIVFLCKCNDRVFPYKVVAVWFENERPKYKLISSSQEKDYNSALRIYNLALSATIKVEIIDQDNICDKNYQVVF